MPQFIDEIVADIDWRVAEMATLKSIPIRYRLTPDHKNQHIKFAVPAIYAFWEGYVKTSLSIYISHLSSLNIERKDISINLLTHHIDTFCGLNNPRTSFDSKKRVVADLDVLFVDTIQLVPEVPTESNVNFKVLTSLLTRFCIEQVDSKYEKGLNRLLFFRNKIAHGENAIRVTDKDMSDFVKLIEDLMIDIVLNIQSSEARRLT